MLFNRNHLTQRLAGVLAAVSIVLATTPVAAQTESPDSSASLDSAARVLFEDGRRAFSDGDYETALARFQQAYDISHRPLLLWNIATTLDRLRRDAEALAMFDRYLREVADVPNRAEVEARMRVLREAVETDQHDAEAREAEQRRLEEERRALEAEREAARQSQQQQQGGQPAPATAQSSGGIGVLHPAIMGVGAGVTGVAVGVLVWSGLDFNTANDNYTRFTNDQLSSSNMVSDADLAQARNFRSQAVDAQIRTYALIGVTAGVAVVTVILAIFTDWDGDSPPSSASLLPSLSIDDRGGSLGLQTRF